MALYILLAAISSLSLVHGQGQGDLMGPVRPYAAITGQEERELVLSQNPDLLEFAATMNERIFIRLDGPQSTAIVAESVNVNMDCFPWLSRFPGGTVQWLKRLRDEDGRVVEPGPFEVVRPTEEDQIDTAATVVGGEFIRWYNITGTLIVAGAEDPSFGDYVCMVCIGRGSLFQQCHNATLTLHIVGAPPVLVKATDNVPMPGLGTIRSFNIGANFCLDFSMNQIAILRCEVLAGVNISQAIPSPSRTWVKDMSVIYSGNIPFSESFLMEGNNGLFIPMVVDPTPLDITQFSTSGSIQLDTTASNLSAPALAPSGVNQDNVRRLVFMQLLGDYMCSVTNIYGSDSAMTNIRECGLEPELPGCDVNNTIFLARDGETVPVGCNVCIPSGFAVDLDCTATSGSNPLMYLWEGPEGFTSTDEVIRVSAMGEFNCIVTNPDSPDGVMLTTNVFITPPSLLTVTITDQLGNQLQDSGCGRLLGSLDPEPDMCLFLGETFDISCASNNMPLNVTYQNGSIFNGPVVVTADFDDMTFQCQTETNTPCDVAAITDTVRVFDPARINRSLELAPGEIGAGQTTDTQTVRDGDTVTLVCPTGGIDDPRTAWSKLSTDMAGGLVDGVINGSEPGLSISTRDDFTLVLTITGYDGDRDNGLYYCRTNNIAGFDNAVVSLSSIPDTGEWIATNFTNCNINCSGGIRVRSVTCRSLRDRRLLPNNECTEPRPPIQMVCSDLFENECFLTPIFVTGDYGPCSKGCEGGFRQRDVMCRVPMTGETLKDQDCFPLRKPRRLESCINTCCIDDTYSTCKRLGSRFCNLNLYQQKCCWTCLLREKP